MAEETNQTVTTRWDSVLPGGQSSIKQLVDHEPQLSALLTRGLMCRLLCYCGLFATPCPRRTDFIFSSCCAGFVSSTSLVADSISCFCWDWSWNQPSRLPLACFRNVKPESFVCYCVWTSLRCVYFIMATAGPLCNATQRHQLLTGENRRGSGSTQHRGRVREKHLYVQQLFTFYSHFSLLTSSSVKVGWRDRFFYFCTAFILADGENGETQVQQAPSNPVLPAVPPKPGTVSCIER